MNRNLTSYIDLLTPYIPTDLISETYLNRIRLIGRQLPALSFGCFECWLASSEPRVDFNIGITGRLNEPKTILHWLERLPEPGGEQHRAVLKKLRTICSAWSDSRSFLESQIRIVWLVYDIPDPIGTTPVPWLYTHFRENVFLSDAVVRPDILLHTLTLLDSHYSTEERESFRVFIQTISPAVQISAIGTPTGRGGKLLRLYLLTKTYADLLRVLTDQQWPGDVNELHQQMSHLVGHCDFYALLIDLNPGIQPKIGIECWFNETDTQTKLMNFTNYLVEDGLCSAQKRAALLTWNGRFETETSPMLWSWPDHLLPATTRAFQRVVIRRMAHYVKFIYEPGKPLVAKGYLYFDRLLNSH
ncbi:hypothetical protein [Spirosoma areae]